MGCAYSGVHTSLEPVLSLLAMFDFSGTEKYSREGKIHELIKNIFKGLFTSNREILKGVFRKGKKYHIMSPSLINCFQFIHSLPCI